MKAAAETHGSVASVQDGVVFETTAGADVTLPRRILVGDGAVGRIGFALQEVGVPAGSVLLIADAAVLSLGATRQLQQALVDAGYDVVVHSDIAHEPDLAATTAVVDAVRAGSYVAVVGCGGGSALDPAKLAAALATNHGRVAAYLKTRTIERPTLPLALVPTTAGTGAEVSRNAIVTSERRKFVISSPLLCPTVALLDPLLTVTCPAAVTAASGMDALAHAVESALSAWATPFTTSNALEAVRIIARWLPRAYIDGSDIRARRAMLHAALLAGLSINASTLLGHSMAYTVATRTQLPHGVTTAMALPFCIAYNAPATSPQLDLLEAQAGVARGTLATWVVELAEKLELPVSLGAVGLSEKDLPSMVEECMGMYPRPNNPVPFDRDQLLRLYHAFLDGDIDLALRTAMQVA